MKKTVAPAVNRMYPTLSSTQDALDYAESKLPLTNKNEVVALVMTVRNTVLKEVQDCKEQNDATGSD